MSVHFFLLSSSVHLISNLIWTLFCFYVPPVIAFYGRHRCVHVILNQKQDLSCWLVFHFSMCYIMSEKQSWSAKRLPLRPTVAFLYAKRELPIEKILESDYYITKEDIQYWRCRNYDQEKTHAIWAKKSVGLLCT